MSDPRPQPNKSSTPSDLPEADDSLSCLLPTQLRVVGTITSEVSEALSGVGCPLARPVQDRLRFESLVAELSATFVNLLPSEVDSQIEWALGQIIHFLDLDRGALAEVMGDGKDLVVTHAYSVPSVVPLMKGVLNDHLPWYVEAVLQGKVLRFHRMANDLPEEATREREYCAAIGMKSHVMIPLIIRGSLVGAVGFASFRMHTEWSDDLIKRLRMVGEIFANALARKRADEDLRQLTARLIHSQEEERRHIAREMHDDWTQRLARFGFDLTSLETIIGDPKAAKVLLREMRERYLKLTADVHALSRQIHPSILDDLGLIEALRSECVNFSRREEIEITYRPVAIETQISITIAMSVYRVAQEALRNLAKHAAVESASVEIFAEGEELVLRVRDEGIGFDPAEASSEPGLGLASMRERIRLVQGRFSIESAPEKGTTIEVRVPLGGSIG